MKNKRGRPKGSTKCQIPESLLGFWLCMARSIKDRENCLKKGNARQKAYIKEAIHILEKRKKEGTPQEIYNKKLRIKRKKL